MSAIAYKLKKLLKWQQRKVNSVVMSLKEGEMPLLLLF